MTPTGWTIRQRVLLLALVLAFGREFLNELTQGFGFNPFADPLEEPSTPPEIFGVGAVRIPGATVTAAEVAVASSWSARVPVTVTVRALPRSATTGW